MEDMIKLIFGIIALWFIVVVVIIIASVVLSVITALIAGGGFYGSYRAIINYGRAFSSQMSFIKTKPKATP